MPPYYQQHRRADFGGLVAEASGEKTDVDMDISVRTRESSLAFTVGIYNLSDSNWSSIRAKDEVTIDLGWLETGLQTVCVGRVENNSVTYENNGADTRYVVEGVDATQEAFSARLSRTWEEADPGQIAADIVGMLDGVTAVQVERAGEPIPGRYPIKNDRPVRYWLDALVDEAAKITGDQWEWRAQAGKFYFRPKSATSEVAVTLGDRVQSVEPATGQSTSDSGGEVQVTAYCHPGVETGGIVSLATDRYSGTYKVAEHEFVSDTISGDHYVQATLVPDGAGYNAAYPGTDAFVAGLSPVRGGPTQG